MADDRDITRRNVLLAAGAAGLTLTTASSAFAAQDKKQALRELAAPESSAKLVWRIDGPDRPDQHPCGDLPPTAYMIMANPADVVDARVLHILWHKTAVGIPEAIDRVLFDTDADQAATKTPHYSHFYPVPHISNLTQELIFGICYFDFCSVGLYDLHVTVIWEDISEVEIDDAGSTQVNHRRYIETKTKRIDAQGPEDKKS